MIIKKAEFVTSLGETSTYPPSNIKEIALLGRSNVGKSSFINAITNNNHLARTSKVPGKTVTLNYYLINEAFYFVDMPGYGYAKGNEEKIQGFSALSDNYLKERVPLKGAVLLIDSRRTSEDDLEMASYLLERKIPFILILTKCDSIKRNELRERIKEVKSSIFKGSIGISEFSAKTREGEEEVLALLDELLS